jgi:uncharacterized membrane protein
MILPWHLYLMAALYLLAGLNHFRNPRLYERIIPDYLPNPKLLNQLSGIAEIILAIGLIIPETSAIAAWGVIALLIAVYPTHFYMLQNEKAGMGLPKWLLILRIPLQLLLIFWAYLYT